MEGSFSLGKGNVNSPGIAPVYGKSVVKPVLSNGPPLSYFRGYTDAL